MIAYYNSKGRYIWAGSPTVVSDGDPAPPPHYLEATHTLYEGTVDPSTEYHDIVNNLSVKMPLKVRDTDEFDWDEKSWYDTRTLAHLKSLQNSYINESRLAANQSTFTFSNKLIAADQLSRSDIDAVHGIVVITNAMPEGWQGAWKAVDNSYVSVTNVAEWTLFYKAMVGQGSTNFAHAQALKAQLALATTIIQVEAIIW